ncbi:dendritic arbor reduction protein 1-like [Zeugodacus cucurbitae]|uniref:dendritic arbor reduction protein 1-like n=1 Tax=Zeugodacus cucurbitae TaxID=28588 RepID=UPI0023D8F9B4|nr:dendritic arbor reduction protein 1-like [Zeugodacus cucurbitae]
MRATVIVGKSTISRNTPNRPPPRKNSPPHQQSQQQHDQPTQLNLQLCPSAASTGYNSMAAQLIFLKPLTPPSSDPGSPDSSMVAAAIIYKYINAIFSSFF